MIAKVTQSAPAFQTREMLGSKIGHYSGRGTGLHRVMRSEVLAQTNRRNQALIFHNNDVDVRFQVG